MASNDTAKTADAGTRKWPMTARIPWSGLSGVGLALAATTIVLEAEAFHHSYRVILNHDRRPRISDEEREKQRIARREERERERLAYAAASAERKRLQLERDASIINAAQSKRDRKNAARLRRNDGAT